MNNILLHIPKKLTCLIGLEQMLEFQFENNTLVARVNRFSHVADYVVDAAWMLTAVNHHLRMTADPRRPEEGRPMPHLALESLHLLRAAIERQGKLIVLAEVPKPVAGAIASGMVPPPGLPPGFAPSAPKPPQPNGL